MTHEGNEEGPAGLEGVMPTKARVLWWIGLLCLVVFLFPTIHREKLTNGTKDSVTLGLPGSPWFVAYRTEIKEESKQESKTKNSTAMQMSFSTHFDQKVSVEFISWSALFGIVGIVLMKGSRWLGNKQANSSGSDT
jgi:hypothetical protein